MTLMDIEMPGPGGIETTRFLLVVHPRDRVLMAAMFEDDAIDRRVRTGVTREQGRFSNLTPFKALWRVLGGLSLPLGALALYSLVHDQATSCGMDRCS